MVNDWIADHAEEMSNLIITEIEMTEKGYEAYAQDKKSVYVLIDDGTGNISINYVGTR